MSRSRRKTPIHGCATPDSEKDAKRLWHKRMRAMEREAIHHDREIMPGENDAVDPYNMPKDGKAWGPKWGYRGVSEEEFWESDWGKELRRK